MVFGQRKRFMLLWKCQTCRQNGAQTFIFGGNFWNMLCERGRELVEITKVCLFDVVMVICGVSCFQSYKNKEKITCIWRHNDVIKTTIELKYLYTVIIDIFPLKNSQYRNKETAMRWIVSPICVLHVLECMGRGVPPHMIRGINKCKKTVKLSNISNLVNE